MQVKESERSVNHRALQQMLVAHYKFQIHGGLTDDAIRMQVVARPSKLEGSETHVLDSKEVRDKGYSLSFGYREPLSISSPLDSGITNAIFQPFTIENVVSD